MADAAPRFALCQVIVIVMLSELAILHAAIHHEC